MKILLTVFFDPQDLGIRYLATYMKKLGHDIRIVCLKSGLSGKISARPSKEDIEKNCKRVTSAHAGLSFWGQSQITEQELNLFSEFITEFNPDIMGFGTRSTNFGLLPQVIPAMKKGAPEAVFVAGGFGPSLEPEIPLKLGVDVVIRGEGEHVFANFVEYIKDGKDWKSLPGLAWLENGSLQINPIPPVEKNLDNFPFPICDAKDLVIIENNNINRQSDSLKGKETWGRGSHFILSSRGCIAECSYCGGRTLRDKFREEGTNVPRLRGRSLDNVIEELKIAKNEKDLKRVIIIDEFFIHPVGEMIRFFKNYKRYIDLPFFAHLSTDQIASNQELLDAAIEAGWYVFTFGLQTGDAKFCKQMYNRINHNENILQAVNMCHAGGMSGYLYMILGNPLEKQESFEKSLSFISSFPKFDDSLKQKIFFETNKLRLPYGNPPIKKEHPELLSMKSSSSKFYYNAMLLEFRLLYDDYDFNELAADKYYKDNPWQLGSLYHDTVESRHMAYVDRELKRLAGKDAYVYGGGFAYDKNKGKLKDINVLGILMDNSTETDHDGKKVIAPANLSTDSKTPIIIMARPDNINPIYRKIKNNFPLTTDIVGCGYFNAN